MKKAKMAQVRIIFYEEDLIKKPSVDCSLIDWLKWIIEDRPAIADWDTEWFETEQYEAE